MAQQTQAVDDALDAHLELEGSAASEAIPAEAHQRAWRFTASGMQETHGPGRSHNGARSDGVLWIDLSTYQAEDLEALARHLGLDAAGVTAALAPWQRPSVTAFADHALVTASVIELDEDQLKVHANEIDCFIGEAFIITAHSHELPFMAQMLERASTNGALIRQDPAYLLYILLDELVDSFTDVAQDLDLRVEDLETQALLSDRKDFLDMLVRYKRFIYGVNRLVAQHGFLFHGLLRPDFPFVSGASVEGSFTELNDHAIEVAGMFDEIKQEMLGTFDIYLSSVSQRTNTIMKTLTMISILVLPASAIFGFFGTNFVQLPFFGDAGFVLMFLLLIALTIGQIMLFRTRGWLE